MFGRLVAQTVRLHADRLHDHARRGAGHRAQPGGSGADAARRPSPHLHHRDAAAACKPGLANAFLVGFIESIADFGNPIVVGGQFSVLSTDIFFAIVGAQYDQGRAASLAWVLTLFALGVFALQRGVLGKQQLHHRERQGRRRHRRCRCPTACAARIYAIALPWIAFTRGRLPVRLRRRLRADLGPRLHAHAGPLHAPRSRSSGGSSAWCGPARRGTRSSPRSSWPAIAAPLTAGARPADRLAAGAHASSAARAPSSSRRCWPSRFRARCSA